MKILISNDDGVFAPGILAAKKAVEDLADVTVVAPSENNSSVGRRLTLFKHLELLKTSLDDGSPAYSLSASPADCVVVGASYIMDEKPDLVISGINSGINISCDITSSGTVCAALEAVSLGIPSIAASLFADPKTCYKQDENGEWYVDFDFTDAQIVLHDLVEKIIDKGFPEGVDLFNLNVPSSCKSREVKLTSLSHRMLDKVVVDDCEGKFGEVFSYPFERGDVEFRDNLIMIASSLVESYEEGSDGYCLMSDGQPSLTPLNVDMTSCVECLKNW